MTYEDLRAIEPTAEQANTGAIVQLEDGRQCMAAWYPQMGGYVAKCWVTVGCWDSDHPDMTPGFDAFIFHDGDFPFGGNDRDAVCIHHCDAEHFVEFGEAALRFLKKQDVR